MNLHNTIMNLRVNYDPNICIAYEIYLVLQMMDQ